MIVSNKRNVKSKTMFSVSTMSYLFSVLQSKKFIWLVVYSFTISSTPISLHNIQNLFSFKDIEILIVFSLKLLP